MDKNKSAEEIVKYKLNSTNHLNIFPVENTSQKQGAYVHISVVYEAAEEYKNQELTTLQQANAELKEEIKTLKRVNGAYKIIKESQEATISHYSKKANDINNAVATLESEREMNAILTSEKEELEKQNAELIGFVKRFHNYTCVQSSGQVRIIDPELVVTEGDQLKYMAQELLIQSHESNKQP